MDVESQLVLDKFLPRWYQREVFDAIENEGYRKLLWIAPRRCGKDITLWNIAIRQCLKRICLVFYCLPTYSQARKAIFDAIAIDGTKFLDFIPKKLVESINIAEMKIRFKNGSILQCIGADTYDTSLVGTNPYAIVLSEYALMQGAEVYSFIRPILAANGGWIAMCSCVSPDTLVIGENGIKRIKDILPSRETYTGLNKPIWGLNGFHNAEQFYYGGHQKTLKITLQSGYEIECTSIHPLWNGKEWVKAQELKVNDLLPIQYGQDIWGQGLDISGFSYTGRHAGFIDQESLTTDFFYLLGLIQSEGYYDKRRITITNTDKDIIDFLNEWGFSTAKDRIHHNFGSSEFCAFLEFLGFKHGARFKTFPESLFSCTKEQMRAFIQGVFDGDGTSNSNKSKRGNIKLVSTCKQFIQDMQVILLNFGIVSSVRKEEKPPTKKAKVWSTIYNLEIGGYFAHIFYEDIGFRLKRKQKHHAFVPLTCREETGNIYPVDTERLSGYSLPKNLITNPRRISRRLIAWLNKRKHHPYLSELLQEKFFYSPIKSIEASENEVFDFVIPETHSFFSNGFISHNTPRGKNHLWHLWKVAQDLPEWHVIHQKTSEIKHIPEEALAQERAQMNHELYLQEYECDFSRGVEGSVYGRCLDELRRKGQITAVPWDPGLLVHVAFDIGVNDATTLIWFSVAGRGQVINIIDCYSNTGVGLDHYAKILQDKPYRYGKYFAPHDIKVREWGGGAISRYEKARQLGIDFEILPQADLMDGIENVLTHFPKFWIDQDKCKSLINALENYRREWDEVKQIYTKPIKNWACHYADALRYLCQSLDKTQKGLTSEEFERQKAQALYGNRLPGIFNYNPEYDRFR